MGYEGPGSVSRKRRARVFSCTRAAGWFGSRRQLSSGVSRRSGPKIWPVKPRGPHPFSAAQRRSHPGVALLALALLAGCSQSHPDAATPQTTAAPSPKLHFPVNPDLVKAWSLIHGENADPSPKDFADAETLAQGVLAKFPNDPDATVVLAQVNDEIYAHRLDRSAQRYARAQKFSEAALQLAPNNPEALAAMAEYVVQNAEQKGGAAQLLHQAIAINGTDARYYRLLFTGVLQGEQQLSTAEEAAAKFPQDYLVQVDLARVYEDFNLPSQAERALSRAVALAPARAPAQLAIGYDALAFHGDPTAFATHLDQIAPAARAGERYAFMAYLRAELTGNPGDALAALKTWPSPTISGPDFQGPTALLVADIEGQAGQDDAAKADYASALADTQKSLAADSTDLNARRNEAWILFHLGRSDEAKADRDQIIGQVEHPYRLKAWWFDVVPLSFLLGDREKAKALLSEASSDSPTKVASNGFNTDPRMAAARAAK